ncbi:DUF1462 family protein, partial [Siminovitchia fortis]|uniref:DUF1462 family protein n=1 Tax=Siminovitchia fortis TaxID=254758 RepID=UPI0021B31092
EHMKNEPQILLYPPQHISASSLNLPSSNQTYQSLQAPISPKFPHHPFKITYIHIFNPPQQKLLKQFAHRLIQQHLFYPLLTIDDEIIAEGNPRLKDVYRKMEEY